MGHAYGAVTVRIYDGPVCDCFDEDPRVAYQVVPDATNAGPGAHHAIVCDADSIGHIVRCFLTGEDPLSPTDDEPVPDETEDPEE